MVLMRSCCTYPSTLRCLGAKIRVSCCEPLLWPSSPMSHPLDRHYLSNGAFPPETFRRLGCAPTPTPSQNRCRGDTPETPDPSTSLRSAQDRLRGSAPLYSPNPDNGALYFGEPTDNGALSSRTPDNGALYPRIPDNATL